MVEPATEGTYVSDVLKYELDKNFCREDRVVGASQTLALGEVCQGTPILMTKLGTNVAAADEVQTITFDAAMTAGTLSVTVVAPDATELVVEVPWTSDWAGTMAAWNTEMTVLATAWLDALASVGAVMTGTATVPILTYSGVGFTSLIIPALSQADVEETTGPTTAETAQTVIGTPAVGEEDPTGIILEAVTTEAGESQRAAFLVRGPAIVDHDFLAYGADVEPGEEAAVDAALLALNILVKNGIE